MMDCSAWLFFGTSTVIVLKSIITGSPYVEYFQLLRNNLHASR